jgi:hypothetical protein
MLHDTDRAIPKANDLAESSKRRTHNCQNMTVCCPIPSPKKSGPTLVEVLDTWPALSVPVAQ